MKREFDAILSDMDGTLFSTFRANFLAYELATQECGLILSELVFRQCWGRDSREFLSEIFPAVPAQVITEIRTRKALHYQKFLETTSLNSALFRLLDLAKDRTRLGLVTTAKRVNVDALLKHHDLSDFFEIIVTGDDVARGKPSPEGYTLAISKLSATPSACLAIEDSEAGVAAAEAAGIPCLRVDSHV